MKRAVLILAVCLIAASAVPPAKAQVPSSWFFYGSSSTPYDLQFAFWPWEGGSPFGQEWGFWNMPSPFSAEWSPWDAEWFWPQWRMWCLAVGDPLLVPPGPAWLYPYGWWGYPYWNYAMLRAPVVTSPSPAHATKPALSRKHHQKPPGATSNRGDSWAHHPPSRDFPSRGGGFSPPLGGRGGSFSPPMGPMPQGGGGFVNRGSRPNR